MEETTKPTPTASNRGTFQGSMCRRGHVGDNGTNERYIDNRGCVACARARYLEERLNKDPDAYTQRAYKREMLRLMSQEERDAYMKQARKKMIADDAERFREYQRNYHARLRKEHPEKLAQYRETVKRNKRMKQQQQQEATTKNDDN